MLKIVDRPIFFGLGMTVGIAACLIIFLALSHEDAHAFPDLPTENSDPQPAPRPTTEPPAKSASESATNSSECDPNAKFEFDPAGPPIKLLIPVVERKIPDYLEGGVMITVDNLKDLEGCQNGATVKIRSSGVQIVCGNMIHNAPDPLHNPVGGYDLIIPSR